MITGVFISDDLSEYLEKNPLFHRILNHEIRQTKVKYMQQKKYNRKHVHETDDLHDPHCQKHLWLRYWWMMFYR